MPLFHATTRNLEIGATLSDASESTYYTNTVPLFEQHRHSTQPHRGSSFFAAESPEFSTFFLIKQGRDADQINVYEVEIPGANKAPFALTHAISRRLDDNKDVTALVREYWNPGLEWNFHEHFGLTMKVLAMVPTPQISEMLLGYSYSRDFDQAHGMT